MKTRVLIILLFVTLFVGCDKEEEAAGVTYLNEVIDIMEKNSVNRKTIDWEKFRSDVMIGADGADTDAKVNQGLRIALTGLGDRHSFIQRGQTYLNSFDGAICNGKVPVDVDVPENIGYIYIPTVTGSSNQVSIDLQNEIRAQDNAGLIGWIVDLRGNGGGNMWPMLAGVGPILGEGPAGHFINPDEVTDTYEYKPGRSVYNGTDVTTVPSPHTLINGSPKVAVLTDNGTASSGEAITIAFVGRPKTKSFGAPTCGVSTANAEHALSDGSLLYLTVSVMADRNKNKKGGPVVPDVAVSGNQEVVNKAIEWLNEE